ncbi:peroxin-3 [Sporothrix schenckii 1099-18]|uniref:Peroxin-3 n=1 Tax=Sporothrix schenckii 1099-18 TaxID=1397361 RepID=A0A0F2LZN8_SPOSC|nr:peroxin-3 [Sporothrix schenckii 1099-18]KJR82299.1 peroxin-3 [Sporothrix schenckii 1099-18]
MFAATRQWFRRHRTPIAIGVGVVGAGYVATQYVLSKLNDARERMSSDRIAKENLRRRFEQNQEDCTFTVLALLPTVTTNILESMNTEAITYQIQHMKTGAAAAGAPARSPPSIADTLVTEDESRSMISMQSESGIHASQVALPTQAPTSNPTTTTTTTAPSAGEAAQELPAKQRKTKRQLWDELTISSITRAYTLLYTTSLLVMLTRIQLNLLGRRSYLSSVVSLATGSAQATISLENNDDDNLLQQQHALGNSTDFEVNRKYLAFSWWLLNRSWADLAQRVETAVRASFGHLSPRDLVSLDNFADYTRAVRQAVERGPLESAIPSRWLSLVLPPPGLEDYVLRESGILADSAAATFEHIDRSEAEAAAEADPSTSDAAAPTRSQTIPSPDSPSQVAALRRMLDETADVVESPTFSHVLTEILDAGFATLLERKVAPVAFDLPPSVGEGSIELNRLRNEKVVQLPKILSVLTRQAHVIGSGMPNEYLHEMEAVRDLEAFAAVVYSSNWESEIHEEGLLAAAEEVRQQAAEAVASGTSEEKSVLTGQAQVDESLVMVDPSQSTLESAWERALDQS